MGGIGSGRSGGRCTVESSYRINIDALIRHGVLRPGMTALATFQFSSDQQDDIKLECVARVGDGPWDSWIRLRYELTDYWTGEDLKIDDKVSLVTTRPPFGGVRWWFICPRSNQRVRMLYLPPGGRHFWSRRTYRLAYGSQSETAHDRAMRRSRKLCRRLGGDPDDDACPDKPKRMRWTTYNRIMDRIAAAERVADDHLVLLMKRFMT